MRLAGVVVWSVLAAASSASWSAERTLPWTTAHCSYTLRYDPKKYDEVRLRNTIDLIHLGEGIEFVTPNYAFTPKAIRALDLDKFQRECEIAARKASDLTLIDLPGLEAYKQAGLEGLRDGCAFGAAEIRGLTKDPGLLREYAPATENCSRYIDALEGKGDLLALWREVVWSSCEKNSNPVDCRNRSLAHETMPDALAWIKLDVHIKGWSKCATKYLKVNADDKEPARRSLQQRFDRMFKVRQQCE